MQKVSRILSCVFVVLQSAILISTTTYDFSTAILSDFVLLSSTSGKNNFEKAKAAGAAITLEVIKCDASAPYDMYAANTVPDTVANPDAIIACNSDAVKYYSWNKVRIDE